MDRLGFVVAVSPLLDRDGHLSDVDKRECEVLSEYYGEHGLP